MRTLFGTGLFSLILYLTLDVLTAGEYGGSRPVVQAVAVFGLAIMLLYCFMHAFRDHRITKHWRFTKIWVIFVGLISFYYVFSFLEFPSPFARNALRELLIAQYCLVSMFFIYYGVVTGALTEKKLDLLLLVLVLNGLIEVYFAVTNPVITNNLQVVNTSAGYVFLMLIPLLVYRYPKVNVWIFLLTAILTMMMGKRGALVIYLVILMYGFIHARYLGQVIRLNKWWLLFMLLVFLSGAYFLENYYDSLQYRFFSIQNQRTGSIASGRDVIWSSLWLHWKHADLFHVIFGFGLYASLSIEGHIAHNDFIEFLVDFGVFGLSVYLLVLFTFYRNIKRVKSYDRYLYIMLMTCLLILVGRGIIAGTIRTDSINLFISMGYLLGIATLKGKARARES